MFAAQSNVRKEKDSGIKSGCLVVVAVLIFLAVVSGLTAQEAQVTPEPAVVIVEVTATPASTATPDADPREYARDMDRLISRFINYNEGVKASLEIFGPFMEIGDNSEEGWEIWREGHMDLVRGALGTTEEILEYDERKVPSCAQDWHNNLVEGMELWEQALEKQANAVYLEDVGMIRESTELMAQANKSFKRLAGTMGCLGG